MKKTYDERGGKDLSRNEEQLIRELRGMKFGSMTIHVKNGEAIRIENKVESILLGTFTGEDIVP